MEEDQITKLQEENARLRLLVSARLHSFAIPDDRLRQLIQLCHPDKHNGSATANEVTQWLLTLKKGR